jgi:hypothetical protein
MGRSLGVVIVGWTSGFLIAIAWGASRANNPRLASILLGLVIAGVALVAFLLAFSALRGRAARRRPGPGWEWQADDTDVIGATDVAVVEQHAAARIAELEARLALEQAELDLALATLAATELASPGVVVQDPVDTLPDPGTVALEPVLRQQVLDTVAELVEHAEHGAEGELTVRLKELAEKGR